MHTTHRGLSWIATSAALAGMACGRPAPPPASPAIDGAAAEQAALYALPLVIMDLTREQFFASPVAADASPNRFLHIPILANPASRAVIRPNVDTLYSTAWLDLTAEPVLLTLPAGDGRYFLVQCMDAWTDVFAAPGIRTLGNRGARYAIVGPGWQGALPTDVEVIHASTPMAWLLGRVYVRDPADLAAARAFQRQLDLRPASRAGDASFTAAMPRPPGAASRPIMRDTLHALGPAAFFERFAHLTAANPPPPRDARFVADVLAPLGIAPGAPLIWANLTESRRAALAAGLERVLGRFDNQASAQQRSTTPTTWSGIAAQLGDGDYGTNYELRATVAMIGLGANIPADAIYMNTSVDGRRQPLDGGRRYQLRFAPGKAPPVRAFWSLTLYDDQGYLIAHRTARFAIRSGDDLAREPDGSLAIYLQPDDPGSERRANWLPTPDHRPFELTLRAYWPDGEMLDGRWSPPAVTPAE